MLLIDTALIILLARALGAVAHRLGQPPVVGEVLAGILVGPTLFHGAVADHLFPVEVRPSLNALATVGVAVFMFFVGLELDGALVRGKGRAVVTVSLSSITLPFCLGVALALYLATRHTVPNRLGFVLFIGAAVSVTAFPVLARILADRSLLRTQFGGLALACAAVGDVLAWVILAVVVALTDSGHGGQFRMLLLIPYVALMLFLVRPLLHRLGTTQESTATLTLGAIGTVLAGLLLSASLTEWMGLHFIFGAFLFGAVMPKEGAERLHEALTQQIGRVSAVLLLPVFFVIAGLKVDLSDLDASGLGDLALILVAAIGGKFAGVFSGARISGVDKRESAALATLMNTRGLTELIVLSVGQQLGVLDGKLYSLMVAMAVLTTVMTGPLLRLIWPAPDRRRGFDSAAVHSTVPEPAALAVERLNRS